MARRSWRGCCSGSSIDPKRRKEYQILFVRPNCASFLYRNRFKSSDLCLGFCDAALDQFSSNPSSNTGLSSTEEKSPMSFVTEPPLGPRPDLIEDDQDDQNGIEEEYDESRCQVEPEDFNEY